MNKRIFLTFIALAAAIAMMNVFADEATAVTNSVAEVAATATDAVAEDADKEITPLEQWVTYWKQGGNTMWFLLALSVLGLGCIFERLWNLRRSRVVPDGFTSKVIELWKEGKLDEVESFAKSNRSMLARVTETLLQHKDSKDYSEVKLFAEDKAGRELRLERRKAAMLSTVSTLAPLLGLFGTVFGLLGAFGTVAAMGEMGDASVLADDIGQALITTVAGLIVAMPALFAFNIFNNKLSLYSVVLEEEVADLVNQLFVKRVQDK